MRELSEDYGEPRSDRALVAAFRCGQIITVAALIGAAALAAWLLWPSEAKAHDAPKSVAMPQGWTYPFSCCSGMDCRQIDQSRVKETRSGYQMPTGEIIPYAGDKRLKDSPDGEMHWCTVQGKEDSRTICLFAPPKSY